ncbi:MAG: hypothetical protein JEZ03_10100 [Bacteroidales bacterium]|nr:hypothetical protein [Bacteroidales bacterium]
MKKILIWVMVLALPVIANAQEKAKEKAFGIKFSGFVKSDFFMDSRQTVAAREGHFLLWPKAESLDANGNDINDGFNTNFLSLQSRLTGKISGPDALGAKTSAVIEGDFFAQADNNINLFRLRHAFIKLNWTNTELLMGQYWNPLFVTDCFAGTVSFNTGSPIQPFARNPQIRLTQKFGAFKILVAALEQRDYVSRGPAGNNSSYLRNSAIPDLHAQLHYGVKSDAFELITGLAYAYKQIKPRMSSTVTDMLTGVDYVYKVNESLKSNSALAFAKLKTDLVTIKIEAIYGENLADALSISGFAMMDIANNATGEQVYTPLRNRALWTDIQSNGKTWQVGCFAGVTENLGTKEEMKSESNPVWGLGTDITMLYRIAPRIVFNAKKLRLALEAEYTSADIGSKYDYDGLVRDLHALPVETKTVANTRLLFSAYYFF